MLNHSTIDFGFREPKSAIKLGKSLVRDREDFRVRLNSRIIQDCYTLALRYNENNYNDNYLK